MTGRFPTHVVSEGYIQEVGPCRDAQTVKHDNSANLLGWWAHQFRISCSWLLATMEKKKIEKTDDTENREDADIDTWTMRWWIHISNETRNTWSP